MLISVATLCTGSTAARGQHTPRLSFPADPAYASLVNPAYAEQQGRQRIAATATLSEPRSRLALDTTKDSTMLRISAIESSWTTPGKFVSAGMPEPETPDLAARVADLEATLRQINDKAAAEEETKAGRPSVKVGGRIMADWTLYHQSPANMNVYGNQEDGFEFRRARMFLKGDAFNMMDYKIAMDFADTDSVVSDSDPDETKRAIQSTAFRDVYITVKELPLLGHVRVGHFKECFGLEQLTSTRYMTFMERSLGDDGALVPGRGVGIMAFDHSPSQRMTWAVGAFRTELTHGAEPPFRRDDGGGTSLTARCTFLPWYDEATEGRGLFHTGIAYSYRDVDDGSVHFRARPESHLGDYVVDADISTAVGHYQLLGLEAAMVYGPFSVQSEYFHAFVDRDGLADPDFGGFYVYCSYFLTGEHRSYKRSSGAFDRVRPFENFFCVRADDGYVHTGKGAWEVAYRFSHIDLDDADILGGRAADHTIGLNWYLNPYTRIMLNYVHSHAQPGGVAATDMNIFMVRAQIDF